MSDVLDRPNVKAEAMEIGTVAALWRYPVKALAAEPLAQAIVEDGGFAGDRAAALIVTDAGHARFGRPLRGKEHNRLHLALSVDAGRALAADGGVGVETARDAAHYFDARPVSLLFDTWLRDVEELVGLQLDPLRYRPNIFARAAVDFTAREATLVGATLTLGTTRLHVVEPIRRCITTTYDIATGQSDARVLRAVAQERANVVGVYCMVAQSGTIGPDDTIVRV